MASVNAIAAKILLGTLLSLAVLAQASLAQAGGGGPICCAEISNPILTIEKLVNGELADTAPGVIVPIGSLVTFTYEVRNIGTGFGLPGSLIRVRDDNETPGLPGDDFFPALTGGIGDPTLDPGDLWIFSATGLALPGLHTNVGVVERLVPSIPEALFLPFASNPGNYTGVPVPASLMLVGSAMLSGLLVRRRLALRVRG